MGPSLQWHVGGGAGGIGHFVEHLMPRMVASMQGLGTPDATPELTQAIVDGVLAEAGGKPVDQLADEENKILLGLLSLRAKQAA
jgi:hypothetical protein